MMTSLLRYLAYLISSEVNDFTRQSDTRRGGKSAQLPKGGDSIASGMPWHITDTQSKLPREMSTDPWTRGTHRGVGAARAIK